MQMGAEGTAQTGFVSCLDFSRCNVHMIGIGGSGMSGAAKMLVNLGAFVAGSDVTAFPGMGALVNSGVRLQIGHQKDLLDRRTDLVVYSAAIPQSNAELQEAGRRGIPCIKYAELLGALMAAREGVAIAGTHGKTTTTAMCAFALQQAELKPSFIFGAHSEQLGGSSGVGSGPHFVVESCEFDRSFLHLHPHAAAILNVERDHPDCFRNLEEVVEAFAQFSENVAPQGLLVCNADCPSAMAAAQRTRAELQTFAIDAEADWRAVNLRIGGQVVAFDVRYGGSTVMSVELVVPGRHNVANALAAAALASYFGADHDTIASAISRFAGVSRRLTWRGARGGVNIIDDYAHHPTEIRVSLEAVRGRYHPKRTWVVFQPHQHERTRSLLDDFAKAFTGADEIVIPDVFDAREADSDKHPVGSEVLASRICENGGRARYVHTLEEAADHVARNVVDGDLVVTMGAGDVWRVADALVARVC